MGLFDGLGSYDSEQRRAAVVRKQVQLLDEQIAEKERRKAQKEQERVREKQEERDQFRTPHAAQVQPASYHMQRPPEPAQFSVSPNAVPFAPAFNLQAAPAPAQPSFLQQLQQQLLYQPLLQLPSLLSQPPQQQLPQLPALPKRSFWEVPSFDVSVRNPHAVLPSLPPKAPRAESVDSRRDAIASRMPSSASAVAADRDSPSKHSQRSALIDIDAEWREWEARHGKVNPQGAMGGERDSPEPAQAPAPEPKVEMAPFGGEAREAREARDARGRRQAEVHQAPPPPPLISVQPPAKRIEDVQSLSAAKLMEEIHKVKRSWSDERDELRSQTEALKRQAMRLQTEQVSLPSPRHVGSLELAPGPGPLLELSAHASPRRRRMDPLPVVLSTDVRGTLRCLDGGGASLFLLEPEEASPAMRVRGSSSSPTAAGPLPQGSGDSKCASCRGPAQAKFCGSCGARREAEAPKASRSEKKKPDAKKSEEEAGQWESTLKSAGKDDSEISQLLSSLQYSDSEAGRRTPVPDSTQRRPSQGFGKVVDLGAELKSGLAEDKMASPTSPGRTQDFLISALLHDETQAAGGARKPPLAPGTKLVKVARDSDCACRGLGCERCRAPALEAQALKAST